MDIKKEHIAKLSPEHLRELIGKLCKCELIACGQSGAAATYGGHQNAPDDGVDVRVSANNDTGGYILKANTIFQVKQMEMTPSAIKDEMAPRGQIRRSIKELHQQGAYIIACGKKSWADRELRRRKNAMEQTLAKDNLKVSVAFYDSAKIASWANEYPSIIIWIRNAVGEPVYGWKSYKDWVNSFDSNEEYIHDDKCCFYRDGSSNKVTVLDGINLLRQHIQQPGSAARLLGLSGTGKTRLVQALFDDKIGNNALAIEWAIYADAGEELCPIPAHFAEHIIAQHKSAVLIIDNCNPKLHRTLAKICRQSLISLLTVEYDIRDDLPEETEVFRLESLSVDVAEKIIMAHMPQVGLLNARTIAAFSDGNARISLSLAKRCRQGDDFARLRDEEIFERLFWQRREQNNQLLDTARVFSLVYSFQAEPHNNIELATLSSLTQSRNTLSDIVDIEELEERGIVQSRGKMKAILPDVIANKLAARCLKHKSWDELKCVFCKKRNERLLTSFSRRLGYLHESEEAQKIVAQWLSPQGILSSLTNLNYLEDQIFWNAAPANQKEALVAIEREVERSGVFWHTPYRAKITNLLRALAYEPDMFDKAAGLMSRAVILDGDHREAKEALQTLFYCELSGTQAPPKQRLAFIDRLLQAQDAKENELGLALLDAALTTYITVSHRFDFGAHIRDFGAVRQKTEWYDFINRLVDLILSDGALSTQGSKLLKDKWRELWNLGMSDALIGAAEKIKDKFSFWSDGWCAIRETIHFDHEQITKDKMDKLESLADAVKPTRLIDRAKMYISSGYSLEWILRREQSNDESIETATRKLGKEIAGDPVVFDELLPDILTCQEFPYTYHLGQGLFDGCKNSVLMWDTLRNGMLLLEKEKWNYQSLRGFLNALSEKNLNIAEDILGNVADDPEIGRIYPFLETSFKISARGVQRIKRAIKNNYAHTRDYAQLAYGMAHEAIDDKGVSEIITLLAATPGGIYAAVEILYFRLVEKSASDVIKLTARKIFEDISEENFDKLQPLIQDHKIAAIIACCYKDDDAKESMRILCKKLAKLLTMPYHSFNQIMGAFAKTHPTIFLDEFLGEGTHTGSLELKFSLNQIDKDIIIKWCQSQADDKFAKVFSAIQQDRRDDQGDSELTPLALKMINNAPNPIAVLNQLNIMPSVWEGSRANIVRSKIKLLTDLQGHSNLDISNWAKDKEQCYKEIAENIEKGERFNERYENEGFE